MSTLKVQLISLAVIIGGLAGSGVVGNQITASAGRNQLTYTDRAEEGMTREEAIGVAAGAFRGVIVNYLWIRANELKQAGKYHEAVDLAKTITRLQPRFPRVWAFHAWNLAYNISVATQTQEERWQWVNAGTRLLRDEAIPKNPSDLLLHKELGWMLLHKVQGMMDDANGHYKRQFALEWTIVLGAPPKRTPEMKVGEDYANTMMSWLNRIAAAPDTLDGIEAAERAELQRRLAAGGKPGETSEGVAPNGAPDADAKPMIGELLKILREAKMDPANPRDRMRLLEIAERWRSMSRRSTTLGVESDFLRMVDPSIRATIEDQRYLVAWNYLLRHMRKRTLEDDYHMEVQRMIRYTQKYGPMDWRHPCSHAVYWSAKGVEAALERVTADTVKNQDFLNTDRITIQSVQELFRSGTIYFDILSPQSLLETPSIDFIDPYGEILEELERREDQQFQAMHGTSTLQRPWTYYRAGYENFLHDAIGYLYRLGQLDAAKKYQLKLATFKGRVTNDIDAQRIRELPLDQFVIWNFSDRITSPNVAISEISASLYRAYIDGLLAGNSEIFRKNFNYARDFHQKFKEEQSRDTPAGKDAQRMLAQLNKEFPLAAAEYFLAAMEQLPDTDMALLFQRAPADLAPIVYDVINARFRPRNTDGTPKDGTVFDKLFPEPENYKAWKASQPKKQPNSTEGKLELK